MSVNEAVKSMTNLLIIPHVLVAQLNLFVDNSKGNELI